MNTTRYSSLQILKKIPNNLWQCVWLIFSTPKERYRMVLTAHTSLMNVVLHF